MSVQGKQNNLTIKGAKGFNTSYVSVQGEFSEEIQMVLQSFNTSYVSVQALTLVQLIGILGVSIHPMCRFKNLIMDLDILFLSFNTSYVSVQVEKAKLLWLGKLCFNTSYVSVQAYFGLMY